MEEFISINNQTKGKLPSLPFVELKNEILGKKYILSIAFVSPAISKKLNSEYRKKNKPTNVLSFSLAKNEGELILCPSVIQKEYKNFDRTYENFVGFLVIHGMLHLKGLEHGSIMENREKKYDQKYFNRNRLGVSSHSRSGGRISKRRKNS